MHVLDADGGAIGGAQPVKNFAQGFERLIVVSYGAAGRLHRTRQEGPVEIPNRKAVRRRIKIGMIARFDAQRIGVSQKMPARSISVDQLDDGGFLRDIGVDAAAVAGRVKWVDPPAISTA